MARRPAPAAQKRQREIDGAERLLAEFVGGGPLDGVRLYLYVVRVSEDEFHVLKRGYRPAQKSSSDDMTLNR